MKNTIWLLTRYFNQDSLGQEREKEKRMKNLDKEARQASLLLSNSKLSRKEFSKMYKQWKDKSFDWRVHLGLIMSPSINKTEFLYLSERHNNHNIMNEEVLAQISRFDIERKKCRQLLSMFLPEERKQSSSYADTWTALERIAMSKLLK